MSTNLSQDEFDKVYVLGLTIPSVYVTLLVLPGTFVSESELKSVFLSGLKKEVEAVTGFSFPFPKPILKTRQNISLSSSLDI